MTKGRLDKKQRQDDQRRKRAPAASALAQGAKLAVQRSMDILAALDDRNLLGASIRDPDSWKPWRALLAAAFGLPLSSDELALFHQCTSRRVPPGAPAAYLWLVIGRRAGKSFCMALIAVFLAAFRDWRKYLSPGERAIVLLVAADREQAKILHRYCQGILRPPILQSLVWNVTASEIELSGGVTIEVVTRSYRSVRGRSVCVAVLDELAFWRDDDSANPDAEVLNAIRALMATLGSNAMVIAGSSPYARRGVLWDAFRRWHAKDDARNLVWQAATQVMNPTISQEFVDAEFERDPASAAAEYGAEFRSDVAEFVSLEVLEACTADGLFELPPVSVDHKRANPRLSYEAAYSRMYTAPENAGLRAEINREHLGASMAAVHG